METYMERKSSSVVDVLVAPGSFFSDFARFRRFGPLVLLAVLALTLLAYKYFYGGMSAEWIVEQQMATLGEISVAEREVIQQMLLANVGSSGMISGASVAIGHLLAAVVLSGAYFLLFLVTGNREKMPFGRWFELVSWCQVPWLINYLIFLFLVFSSSNPDLPLSLPQYASLGELFFGSIENGGPSQLLRAMNLFHVWIVLLAAIGIHTVTRISFFRAVAISLVPYALFFGGWFLFTLV